MSLTSKILEVNRQVTTVEKGGTNNFNKYSYSRLGDILAPLRPVLQKLGLVVTQSTIPLHNKIEEIGTKYYSNSAVQCTTTVFDTETGESLSVESVGFSMDANGDKAAYKAITGARKYGITSIFCLDWDAVEPEDDSKDVPRATHSVKKSLSSPSRKLF